MPMLGRKLRNELVSARTTRSREGWWRDARLPNEPNFGTARRGRDCRTTRRVGFLRNEAKGTSCDRGVFCGTNQFAGANSALKKVRGTRAGGFGRCRSTV
jgi:hypothetical protein